jgi:hypothetical protein
LKRDSRSFTMVQQSKDNKLSIFVNASFDTFSFIFFYNDFKFFNVKLTCHRIFKKNLQNSSNAIEFNLERIKRKSEKKRNFHGPN